LVWQAARDVAGAIVRLLGVAVIMYGPPDIEDDPIDDRGDQPGPPTELLVRRQQGLDWWKVPPGSG
jgi:hypothetical protein